MSWLRSFQDHLLKTIGKGEANGEPMSNEPSRSSDGAVGIHRWLGGMRASRGDFP